MKRGTIFVYSNYYFRSFILQAETEEEMNAWIGTLQAAKYDAAGLQGNKQLSAVNEIDFGENESRQQTEGPPIIRASTNVELDYEPDNDDVEEETAQKDESDGGSASDEKDSSKSGQSVEL